MGKNTWMITALLVVAAVVEAYLPGVAPIDYNVGDVVELKVNKLTSVKTQLPYHFYDKVPFCKPAEIVNMDANLGEFLSGDRLMNSLYHVHFRQTVECAELGTDQTDKLAPYTPGGETPKTCATVYNQDAVKIFADFVKKDYLIQWTLDSLPAARVRTVKTGTETTTLYDRGFPLGFVDESGDAFLYNHVALTVRYHKLDDVDAYRVVGFEVEPSSVSVGASEKKCEGDGNQLRLTEKGVPVSSLPVTWTYSVTWVEDPNTEWSQRWDKYFASTNADIHWFSILNSILIVLFLTGMIATILMRMLHRDLRKYSEQLESREDAEETGWKLVHGDVFRTPKNPVLLCVFSGFGAQVFVTAAITLICAILGLLSPANPGALVTTIVIVIMLGSIFSGYVSTRMYKMFKGENWKRNMLMTAFMVPGIIGAILLFINFFVWGVKSSGGVSFTGLLALIGLFLGIELPLNFVGSYLGFKQAAIEYPVGTNQIPRLIPERAWYNNLLSASLLGGLLPFAAVFIELHFILGALWGNEIYYVFGFLFVVFLILAITCAEISVVMVYFQLCGEDYHWWWRSFLTSGSSACYLFFYSIFYFATSLEITNFISGLLFFGYTVIICIVFFMLTGLHWFPCLFHLCLQDLQGSTFRLNKKNIQTKDNNYYPR